MTVRNMAGYRKGDITTKWIKRDFNGFFCTSEDFKIMVAVVWNFK